MNFWFREKNVDIFINFLIIRQILSYMYIVESSFLELRCKEVVNVCDGKRLGHIIDVVFDLGSACVLGFVLPGEKTGWNLFKPCDELFLPYGCIVRIGEDTILVEMPTRNPPINPYVLSQGEKKK